MKVYTKKEIWKFNKKSKCKNQLKISLGHLPQLMVRIIMPKAQILTIKLKYQSTIKRRKIIWYLKKIRTF